MSRDELDAVSGTHSTSLDLGTRFIGHFGYPYIVMHRGDLLRAHCARAGVELRFGARLDGILP